MGDEQEACNTGLHLGLGIGDLKPIKKRQIKSKPVGGLSFSLASDEEEETAIEEKLKSNGSSFSCSFEEDDEYRHPKTLFRSKVETKKLKLTNEQSHLLESSFEFCNTLNRAQKQALSKQLGLKPRQIEVWFQNRRARTKLKQTETDCELLKQWCNRLLNENRRLKMELQNLRSTSFESSPSIYMSLVSKGEDTHTTCPYCGDNPNGAVLSVVPKSW